MLASADGTVLEASSPDDGRAATASSSTTAAAGSPHYIHLESLPPLTVGQSVAQGEQIGRVGNSGTERSTCTTRRWPTARRCGSRSTARSITRTRETRRRAARGAATRREADEPELPDELVHAVRPERQALPARLQAGTGADEDRPAGRRTATGIRPTSGGHVDARAGRTSRRSRSSAASSTSFAYKSSTGEVELPPPQRQRPRRRRRSASGNWAKGWTNFMPFCIGGQPYYIAYNSLNGSANIDRINAEGNGATNIYGRARGRKGWTDFMPFVQGGTQYLLLVQGRQRRGRDRQDHRQRQQRRRHRASGRTRGRRAGRASFRSSTTAPCTSSPTRRPRARSRSLKVKANGQGIQTLGSDLDEAVDGVLAASDRRRRRTSSPTRHTPAPSRC